MALRIGTELPSLEGATEWLTGNLETVLAETAGKVTLIHFWSLSCGICKENMPRLAEWRDQKHDSGLRVVAVHMPRYPADTDLDAVKAAIDKYQITEPCAIDNDHKLRDAFKNDHGYVPAYYLFDQTGKLKGFAAGERGISLIAPAIERALNNAKGATV
jgi:thiol-disulfide isomerase/thioredoxin